MLEKELQEVGLQEKEAKIYLAALELGQSTVQKIAQKADIKRPTTYFIIEGLMKRGVMSSFYQGKRQYFVAENPERLLEMLEKDRQEIARREERFKTLLPQLSSINNRHKDKPVVKYYEGKEGVVSMVKEYQKMSSGQEVSMAHSRDIITSVFDEATLKELSKGRTSHSVKARSIYTWTQGEMAGSQNSEAMKLSPEDFPVTCDIAIYNDKIRIASLKDRIVGVVIEDKEIAKSFQAIFNLAWKWAKEHKK